MSSLIPKHSCWIKRIVSAAWNSHLLLLVLLSMTRREGRIVHCMARVLVNKRSMNTDEAKQVRRA